MDDWHDPSCQKPDILAGEGFVSCQRCGSFQTTTQTAASETGNNATAASTPIYEPLEGKTDIRLLKVEPGNFKDPIRCSLSLSNITSRAQYEAISYTWSGEDGNMEKTGRIKLGENTVYVTPNCELALRSTRSISISKLIWIDAICINQDDVNERGHQVRVMPQIYSEAQQVLVYVGEASPGDEELFDFLLGKHDGSIMHVQQRDCLARFFKRRYFSRVWVLQEISLARKATVICGRHVLPLFSIQRPRLNELSLLSDERRLPPVIRVGARAYRDSKNLLELLDLARNSQATDPRDKVFAVYGLMFLAEEDGLVADYTKSTEDVFIDVANWIARIFGLPALFARTVDVIQPDENAETDMHQWDNSSLPMWVPDWTKRTTLYNFQYRRIPTAWQSGPNTIMPAMKLARMSPFITVNHQSITFPGFRLGSIADVQNEDMYKSPFNTHWDYFEHCLDECRSSQRKTIKHHTITRALQPKHQYERTYIYLIPQPADYGNFIFEEPGFVSVSLKEGNLIWTHESRYGIKTNGHFDTHAVCCWESDMSETKMLCGLLRMGHKRRFYSWSNGFWRIGEFETVVAGQAFQSSWVGWGQALAGKIFTRQRWFRERGCLR